MQIKPFIQPLGLIVIFAFIVGCASRPTLDEQVPGLFSGAHVGTELSIAVITADKITHFGFYLDNTRHGWRAVDNQQAVFETGSISKLFTAYMASELAERDQLDLNAGLQTYLPELPNELSEITLNNLLSHQAGLPFLPSDLDDMPVINSNPFAGYDRAKLLDYLLEVQLRAHENQYHYSNLGYAVVGLALEASTDLAYSGLLDTLIVQPMALTQTSTERGALQANLVEGLNLDGSTALFWDFAAFTPSGGIYSSAEDIARFLQHQLKQDQPAVARMQQPQSDYSALGWAIQQDGRRTWYEQTGATGGFSSAALLDLHQQKAVLVLANISGLDDQAYQVIELAEWLLYR